MAALSARRVWQIAGLTALVALAISVVAIALDPAAALLAYLAAYATVASIAIGALVLLLIGYATNARWLAALRRVHEAIVLVFPILAVLFVPIALGVRWIYVWADHPVPVKQAWLNPAGFIIRSALYLAVFIIAAEVLRTWSRRRDGTVPAGDPEAVIRRERVFAAATLPPVALALTFAGIDWLMSLEPLWVSSMFPVYFFAGGFSAAIAVLAIVAAIVRVPLSLTGHHFHALGRMLFAFVVFWTYTAYFQGFLIQIANRPSEVSFFVARTRDGWGSVLALVVAARFVLPFFLLLPRTLKHRPAYVAMVAAIVLGGHVLDVSWVALPSAAGTVWLVVAPVVGIAAACVAFATYRASRAPLVASGDPFLPAALRYESPT